MWCNKHTIPNDKDTKYAISIVDAHQNTKYANQNTTYMPNIDFLC